MTTAARTAASAWRPWQQAGPWRASVEYRVPGDTWPPRGRSGSTVTRLVEGEVWYVRTRRTVALVAVVLMQVAIVAAVVARSPLATFVVLMACVLG